MMPGVDEDDLDGITREELVAKQIAKRRELLEPRPDIEPALTEIDAHLGRILGRLDTIAELMDRLVSSYEQKLGTEKNLVEPHDE